MKFLDGKTKKWIALAAMVLLGLFAMGLKLNFLDTKVLGFTLLQVAGALTVLGAWWIFNKEISLV